MIKNSIKRSRFASIQLFLCVLAFVTSESAHAADAGDLKLGFAVSMGGIGRDNGNDIAVDHLGNVYTTGVFWELADFDPSASTANLVGLDDDIFVHKMDRSGNLVWAVAFGGTSRDEGAAIEVDNSGNVYISGMFRETVDFDPGPDIAALSSLSTDIFVLKLDSDGNFLWVKAFGGAYGEDVHNLGNDEVFSLDVDNLGNVYTTGLFIGTADFDPGEETFSITSTGIADIFVHKLDSNGDFVWAKTMDGTWIAAGQCVKADDMGNVYITGSFKETVDFDPGPGIASFTAFDSESVTANVSDIFVQKLDSDGNLVWVKAFGGASSEQGTGIAVDSTGNVYTTGWFRDTVDFDPGPNSVTISSMHRSDYDVFVQKLDSDGNFVWVKILGSPIEEEPTHGWDIEVDESGDVYTLGNFQGTVDFDPGPDTTFLSSIENRDIFVQKMDSDGEFVWVETMGGLRTQYALALAVGEPGNVYITGFFEGTADFDPGEGTAILDSIDGHEDIFVVKLRKKGGSSDSCFIATAAYGTPLAEDINVLRGFRDSHLLTNAFGSTFADAYYRLSPPIADRVASSTPLATLIRFMLTMFMWWGTWLLAGTVLTGWIAVLISRRLALHVAVEE